jgi:hypothetical protein
MSGGLCSLPVLPSRSCGQDARSDETGSPQRVRPVADKMPVLPVCSLFLGDLGREEPEQPALARWKIDIDQRHASLGKFQ